jgi:hypothetical protein
VPTTSTRTGRRNNPGVKLCDIDHLHSTKLQQSFPHVRQVLDGEGLSTPGKSAAESQETAREARQARGAISMSELALEESTLPAFDGIYT